MGWDGAGSYTRQRNFSADASAGIKILASAMDQEFNDFASAMTVAVARDGQNVPSANLPMGGRRHVNVGAAVSATDYMRVAEFIRQIPIYVVADGFTEGVVSVSAAIFTTVSAGQAPPDGSKLAIKFPSSYLVSNTSAGTSLSLNLNTPTGSVVKSIVNEAGAPLKSWNFAPNGDFEFIYSSAFAAWQGMNYLRGQSTTTRGVSLYATNAAGTSAGTAPETVAESRVINNGRMNAFRFDGLVTGVQSITCSVSAYRAVLVMNIGDSPNILLCGSESSVTGNIITMMVSGIPSQCRTIICTASIDIIPIGPSLISAGAIVSVVPCMIFWEASGVRL